ncbi:MAG: carbohydrate ABC transporter permease [Jatrophihabitans sp.]
MPTATTHPGRIISDAPVEPTPRRRARRQLRTDIRRQRIVAWAAIVVIGCFGLLPVYWLLVTSLTPDGEVFQFPPRFFPTSVTISHFTGLTHNSQLLRYLVNSAIVSVVTALLSVVVSAYMAYSFSKFRYPGRKALMYSVLASQMFPQALLLVTLYALFNAYGLLNTYLALILSFSTFTLPLCVWMLKGFFDGISDSLIESARIDGASRWRTLHSVVLPLTRPGLIAAGLFAFVRGWNDFIFALTLSGPKTQTLPPGLVNTYIGEFQTSWADLMAASLVVSIPVVLAFTFLQRYLVAGLASGAVKG